MVAAEPPPAGPPAHHGRPPPCPAPPAGAAAASHGAAAAHRCDHRHARRGVRRRSGSPAAAAAPPTPAAGLSAQHSSSCRPPPPQPPTIHPTPPRPARRWTNGMFIKHGAVAMQMFPYGWRLPDNSTIRGCAPAAAAAGAACCGCCWGSQLRLLLGRTWRDGRRGALQRPRRRATPAPHLRPADSPSHTLSLPPPQLQLPRDRAGIRVQVLRMGEPAVGLRLLPPYRLQPPRQVSAGQGVGVLLGWGGHANGREASVTGVGTGVRLAAARLRRSTAAAHPLARPPAPALATRRMEYALHPDPHGPHPVDGWPGNPWIYQARVAG